MNPILIAGLVLVGVACVYGVYEVYAYPIQIKSLSVVVAEIEEDPYKRVSSKVPATNPKWFKYSDTYDFKFNLDKKTVKPGETITITGNGHPRSQVYAIIVHPDGEMYWKGQLAVVHKTHDWKMQIQIPHYTPEGQYKILFQQNRVFDNTSFKVMTSE